MEWKKRAVSVSAERQVQLDRLTAEYRLNMFCFLYLMLTRPSMALTQ